MIQLYRPHGGEYCYRVSFSCLTRQCMDRQPHEGLVQHFHTNWNKSHFPQDISWHLPETCHVKTAIHRTTNVEGTSRICAVRNLHSHTGHPQVWISLSSPS